MVCNVSFDSNWLHFCLENKNAPIKNNTAGEIAKPQNMHLEDNHS